MRKLWMAAAVGVWLTQPGLGQPIVPLEVQSDPPSVDVYYANEEAKGPEAGFLGRTDPQAPVMLDRSKFVTLNKATSIRLSFRKKGYRPREGMRVNLLADGKAHLDEPGPLLLQPLPSYQWPVLGTVALLGVGFAVGRRRRRPVALSSEGRQGPAWELLAGDVVNGYQIEERLGEGATAVVYRAVAEGPPLALKLLKPIELRGPDMEARFRREMKALRRLRHPNIPYLYDFGQFHGLLYLAMELITGPTLAQRLRDGPLPLDQCHDLFRQLAGALGEAHKQGVLHRDVKPDNVLFPPDGRPRLTDFGLARSHDSTTLTAEGAMMGTPSTMAPEVVSGQGASEASDQYSMGCLMYEALTGKPVFEGESALAVAIQQVGAPPTPVRDLRPEVPESLAAVVEQMLEKLPENRFPNLEAVVARLG